MSVLNGTISTTDLLKQRRNQSKLKKAEKSEENVQSTVNPFQFYAEHNYQKIWGTTTQNDQRKGEIKIIQETNGEAQNTIKSNVTKTTTQTIENNSKINHGPKRINPVQTETKSGSTTVMKSTSTSISATKISSLNSTQKQGTIQSSRPTTARVVLRDTAIQIGNQLKLHPKEFHVSNSDFLAFRFTNEHSSQTIISTSSNKRESSSVIYHTITPLKLLAEIKKAAKDQVTEINFVKNPIINQEENISNPEASNPIEAQSSEIPTNDATIKIDRSDKISKKILKDLKDLPFLEKLEKITIEHTPKDSLSSIILNHLIQNSNCKKLEVVKEFIVQGFSDAVISKNTIESFTILPSVTSNKVDEDIELSFDTELKSFFKPSQENFVSNLHTLNLFNIHTDFFQYLSNLQINSLSLESNESYLSGSSQNVNRIENLDIATIKSNDSNYINNSFNLLPESLKELRIEVSSEESLSLSSDLIASLTSLTRIELINVAPQNIVQFLTSSKNTLRYLSISYTNPNNIDNNILSLISRCKHIESVRINNAKVTNQTFNILRILHSPLQGITLEKIIWYDDQSSWDQNPEVNTNNNDSDTENSERKSINLKYIWLNNVNFKISSAEETPVKGKAPPKKPAAKGQAPEKEFDPSDADFMSLCKSAPYLEALIIRNSNFEDAHLELLNSLESEEGDLSCIRTSIQLLEIEDSSKQIQQPKLKKPFTSLKHFYIYSRNNKDYIQLDALLHFALLCPSIETLRIAPLDPHVTLSPNCSTVFESITEFSTRISGSMWGKYLKDAIFKKEIIPRLLQKIEEIYELDRDRSRVRNGIQKSATLNYDQWKGRNEFERILKSLFDSIFQIVGPEFD